MSCLSWSLWLISVFSLPFWNSIRCLVSLRSVPEVSPEGLQVLTGACGRGGQPCSSSTTSGAGNEEAIQLRFVDCLVQLKPANGISGKSPCFTIQTPQYTAADYFLSVAVHMKLFKPLILLWEHSNSSSAWSAGQLHDSFVVSSLPKEPDKTNVLRFLADVILALHFLLLLECYYTPVIEALSTRAPRYSSDGKILNGYQEITSWLLSLFFNGAVLEWYHCISQWLEGSGKMRRECLREHMPCSHPAVMAAWLLCRDMKCAGWQEEVIVTWLLRLAQVQNWLRKFPFQKAVGLLLELNSAPETTQQNPKQTTKPWNGQMIFFIKLQTHLNKSPESTQRW